MQEIKLPVVSGRTFTHETVRLDGKRFENCKFIRCELIYSGVPADVSACEFSPNTVWKFEGQAATIMAVLQMFGWRFEYGTGSKPEPLPLV